MTSEEEYIEEVGLFYEKYGLPKMAGRILGCLMISETGSCSFVHLQDQLKASKGSISGNINLLVTQGIVDKFMITGDRKSYYRISMNSLENLIDAKLKSVTTYRELLEKALELSPKKDSENTGKIKDIIDYYQFMEAELPRLRIKWKNLKNK